MTYKKQQWKTGEIITEGKLNHIEDGIYNTDNDLTESKTLFADNILDLQTNKANQSDVVSINQEIDNISADLAAAEVDITTKAAQADVDTISNEVDTLQTQVTTNTNNIKSLQDNTVNKSELGAKQDKLTAGNNITIVDNVISATTSGVDVPEVTGTKPIVVTNNNISLSIGDGLVVSDSKLTADFSSIDNQLNNKVDKVTGKSLIADTEITRLADVHNYDDTDVKGSISNLESTKQDKLIAGDNISIENTTDGIKISSTSSGGGITVPGTTYQELSIPTASVWYKSPGNGYITARFNSSGANQFCQLAINTTGKGSLDDNAQYNSTQFSVGPNNGMSMSLLINEDQYWACNWNFGHGCTYIRFTPLINK